MYHICTYAHILLSLFVSLYLTTTTYLDDKEEEEVKEKKI